MDVLVLWIKLHFVQSSHASSISCVKLPFPSTPHFTVHVYEFPMDFQGYLQLPTQDFLSQSLTRTRSVVYYASLVSPFIYGQIVVIVWKIIRVTFLRPFFPSTRPCWWVFVTIIRTLWLLRLFPGQELWDQIFLGFFVLSFDRQIIAAFHGESRHFFLRTFIPPAVNNSSVIFRC